MRQGCRRPYGRGFTLPELMVVVAIAAMLIGWGVGALGQIRRHAEVTAISNGLLGLLEDGRNLALARRAKVVMCPSADSLACGDSWNRELLLFYDRDNDGQRQDGEEIVSAGISLPARTYMAWSSFRGKPYMAWESNGQPYASNGTFTLCNEEKDVSLLRQFVINRSGRVRQRSPEAQGGEILQAARAACSW